MANLDLFVKEKVDIIIEYQHEHKLGRLIAERIAGTELSRIALSRWQGMQTNLDVMTDSGTEEAAENRVAGTIDAFREIVQIPDKRITILNSENAPLSAKKT